MSALTYTVVAGRYDGAYITLADPAGRNVKYIDDFPSFEEAWDKARNLSGLGYDFVELEIRDGDYVNVVHAYNSFYRPLIRAAA